MEIPEGSACAILGVSRDATKDTTMQSIRASCAPPQRVNAPFLIFSLTHSSCCVRRRASGIRTGTRATQAAAQEKFQEISEAYQTLSNEVRRAEYDQALEAAVTQEQQKAAAQKFRAQSWNTKVPDVGERLQREKGGGGDAAAHYRRHGALPDGQFHHGAQLARRMSFFVRSIRPRASRRRAVSAYNIFFGESEVLFCLVSWLLWCLAETLRVARRSRVLYEFSISINMRRH